MEEIFFVKNTKAVNFQNSPDQNGSIKEKRTLFIDDVAPLWTTSRPEAGREVEMSLNINEGLDQRVAKIGLRLRNFHSTGLLPG